MIQIALSIPESFLDEETRCGYHVSRQMKEVWAIELDLAQKLLSICQKHDLKIFADWGTLLGAIRHKGFIPWDDDIDFSMLRKDYDKLREIADREFHFPYNVQFADKIEDCFHGHAKIRNSLTTGILKSEAVKRLDYNQGIFIDIFPLDNVPDNKIAAFLQKEICLLFRILAWGFAYFSVRYFESPNRLLRYPKKWLYLMFRKPSKKMMKMCYKIFLHIAQRYNSEQTSKVSVLSFNPRVKARCAKDFDDIEYIPFEFLSFPVVKNYEKSLTSLYGDWSIPRKGTSAHGEVFFNTDLPYNVFINGNNPIEFSK